MVGGRGEEGRRRRGGLRLSDQRRVCHNNITSNIISLHLLPHLHFGRLPLDHAHAPTATIPGGCTVMHLVPICRTFCGSGSVERSCARRRAVVITRYPLTACTSRFFGCSRYRHTLFTGLPALSLRFFRARTTWRSTVLYRIFSSRCPHAKAR